MYGAVRLCHFTPFSKLHFFLNFVFRVTLQRRFAIEVLPLSIYVSVLFFLFSFFSLAILCAVEDHLFFFSLYHIKMF